MKPIGIKEAHYLSVTKLGRAIIARKNKKGGYLPVGLKCSKRDVKSLKMLYNSYAYDLIHGLLIDYGVSQGLITIEEGGGRKMEFILDQYRNSKRLRKEREMPTKAELEQEVSKLTDKLKKLEDNQRLVVLEGIVNFIHLQTCPLNHDDQCGFYQETSMEYMWEQQEHKKWLGVTEEILRASNLDPEDTRAQAIIANTLKYYKLIHSGGFEGVHLLKCLLEL